MRRPIVRLSSLQLTNIKNVKKGTIYMPNTVNKILSADKAEILGIYGQNGSGKTAIVDALYFLQKVMIGVDLDQSLEDYMDMDSDTAEIFADFNIFMDGIVFEIGYRLSLSREEKEVIISRETLSAAKNENGIRTNKTVFMDYQRDQANVIFKPQKRLDEILEENKEIKTDLIVARKMAEKSNCSYIFGESSRDIFCREYKNGFQQFSVIISSLFEFALKDLFVIRNTHSGVISANFVLPMAFRIENDNMGAKGDFTVSLTEPILVDEERKNLLETIVEQINIVLYTIIPGLQVTIKNYGKQSLDNGEEGWKLELMSKREGMKEIPIRMESEGIIKIISILNALIQAFGNPSICLVIDELDSGIFEYMLGELLDIFKKSAKGQLIFTSHNLRALEMIDKESIMFSTTNPDNRYIHMKNVRESNNLRNMYIRSITLGGQSEQIYEETDSLKIARAFRKAGRGVRGE
ncbi:AAA ATPase-like protein [Faecalimonas umbilicata]|uniref:AAA ATPase-like protein n=1 Tax=Faecalimonas umbilicata TaxID=1912855 RepID=A0A4R3J7F4_9FIRM|nr:AAA family ATPase [Faecalimonas umbilicata]TCS60816.1 AAA ATPase-like protein [Faecalimonas umbilicata]GBU03735.1 DNA repair ATPase [Faecalimonas umbilicata]